MLIQEWTKEKKHGQPTPAAFMILGRMSSYSSKG